MSMPARLSLLAILLAACPHTRQAASLNPTVFPGCEAGSSQPLTASQPAAGTPDGTRPILRSACTISAAPSVAAHAHSQQGKHLKKYMESLRRPP